MSAETTADPSPPPPHGPLWLVIPGWLVPGLGFWLRGRWARGWTQFLMVVVTFALGLALHGGVAWPTWRLSNPEFNLINNITVIIQLGAGLPALASLWASQHGWAWLGGVPQNPYYELGAYYLIVAGAVNYFAACNLSDRLLRPVARFLPKRQPAAESESAS
jgi:hypothetical protein